jgi:hypothetical protein
MVAMRVSSLWLLSIAMTCLQTPAQVAATPAASTQAVATPATDRLVDELMENAARDHATLPSLTAHESIISKADEFVFVGKNTAKAEATVHIVRKPPEGNWTEIREFTVFNGKPVTPRTRILLPFNLVDSYNDTESSFFSVKNRPCYSFALAAQAGHDAPLELVITPIADAASSTQCKGDSGTARIDPATHHLTHLEYNHPAGTNYSRWFHSIDYAATKVGDKTFWLPAVVTTRVVIGKTPNEWTARYSDYHQYTASVKILPADGSTQ